jgi:hypothetical protein
LRQRHIHCFWSQISHNPLRCVSLLILFWIIVHFH